VVVLNLTHMLAFMVLWIYLKPSGSHRERNPVAIAWLLSRVLESHFILFRCRTPGLSRGSVYLSFSVPSLSAPVRRLPIIDPIDLIIVPKVKSVINSHTPHKK